MIKYQGLSTLEVLKEAKNYNKWIADSVHENLSTPVLEIGAGTGNLSTFFLDITPFYITDKDPGLVKNLRKKFQGNKGIHIRILDITKPIPKDFYSFFSCVFAINVLEHIEDDINSLKNIRKLLKRKGKLLLLVPAKKKAFTKLDTELGHYRRYEKQELINKLVSSGYKVEKIYFFNVVGLISWILRDKVHRNNFHLKPYHITLFDKIVPSLRIIENHMNIPIGISLIAVATKK